jgi:hypothetical protein
VIVDSSSVQWIAGSAIVTVISSVAYLLYALLSPNGPRGGSPTGLVFAFAGSAVIVFECLLSARKKFPASPLGRVKVWMRAHVWLGLLSFVLILFHAGFRWGEGLAAALMWIFAIVTASGVFGIVLQNYLPKRMTELVSRETIYEQIPTVVDQLRREADERVEFLTADLAVDEEDPEVVRGGGVKRYYDEAQKRSAAEKIAAAVERRKSTPQIEIDAEAAAALRAHYLQEIRPFLMQAAEPFSRKLFRDSGAVAAYFAYLRTVLPVAAHSVLGDIEDICEERRELAIQARLHRWLHRWLYVHVPLSFALLVLTAAHAVISLRY